VGRKGKLSVSVAARLLEDLDRAVELERYRSRSTAVEAALEQWAREQRDAEWVSYYATRTAEERAEEEGWAELSYQSFVHGEGGKAHGHGRRGRRR
jgi:metal-responsive CopG/Arc/MetJ family transcriptional regulator